MMDGESNRGSTAEERERKKTGYTLIGYKRRLLPPAGT